MLERMDTHKFGLNRPVSVCSTSFICTKIFCPGMKQRRLGDSNGTGDSWILPNGIRLSTEMEHI